MINIVERINSFNAVEFLKEIEKWKLLLVILIALIVAITSYVSLRKLHKIFSERAIKAGKERELEKFNSFVQLFVRYFGIFTSITFIVASIYGNFNDSINYLSIWGPSYTVMSLIFAQHFNLVKGVIDSEFDIKEEEKQQEKERQERISKILKP